MTTAPTVTPALAAARLAQKVYVKHFAWCQAAAYCRPCRECRRLELEVSAAYARAERV